MPDHKIYIRAITQKKLNKLMALEHSATVGSIVNAAIDVLYKKKYGSEPVDKEKKGAKNKRAK